MSEFDCNTCFYRNDDEACSKLSCIGYRPSGYADNDVIKAAARAHDLRQHASNKHSGREVQYAAQRVHDARQFEFDSGNLNLNRHRLKPGDKLWYRNKFTGEVENGVIIHTTDHEFSFRFHSRTVRLGYSLVGERLFLTEDEARRFSRRK